jgi:pyruvate, water dikinase
VGWLERLCQRGYSVRPGWVLSAATFEQAILKHLPFEAITQDEVTNPNTLQNRVGKTHQELHAIAQTLQAAIQTTQFSETTVSVMASALGRMPHQQWQLKPSLIKRDSLLHLSDAVGLWDSLVIDSSVDALVEAIRQLWCSTFSAQNLFYWFSHHCQLEHIKFALLVQSVGSVTCSGFLRISDRSCLIEAVWGMSHAIFLGDVLPARYEITWDGVVLAQEDGHQILAYHSDPVKIDQSKTIPPFDPQANPIDTASPFSPALFRLHESLREQSPLSGQLCTTLRAIAQRLWQDFRTPVVVEWSYGADEDEPAQVWLVSVEALDPSHGNSEPFATFPPHPTSAFPQQLSGLPASSGKVSGSAFVLTHESPVIDVPPSILIATRLGPIELSLLRQVQGVITEQGGLTSHGAILARELGIPAVVGVAGATQTLQSGDWVILDGDRGEIQYRSHPTLTPNEAQTSKQSEPALHAFNPTSSERSTRTTLYVNLSQTESLDTLRHDHLDGVGLLRSEFMMLAILERQHPLIWIEQGRGDELSDRLAHQIHQFMQAFAPRPVFYRFLDLHGQVLQDLTGHSGTDGNSVLGLRGALSYQHFPELFRVELAALRQVQATGGANLHVLVPFVRSVVEFEFCRSHIHQAGLLKTGDLQIWMMVEVPSVLFQLPDYQQAGVQGISIGSNDLTQLLLGVDRDHRLSEDLDARHPAMQRAIATLIQHAKDLNLPCSICGDAPVLYPELIEKLVTWGITAISVNANAIEATYQAIVQAEERLGL